MMRLNAPIQAILALAVLSFLPAPLLAKPAHHSHAHKSTAAEPAPTKRAHKNPAAENTVHTKAHPSAPATTRQVHSTSHRKARHPLITTANAPAPEKESEAAASEPAPRKATSEDFLKAAAGQSDAPAPDDEAPHIDKALAIKTPPSESEDNAPATRPTRAKIASPDKPVSVVTAVRKTTERPQLEPVEEAAATPVILPALYNKRGHLIVPPPLKGSHEILLRQNQVADRDGLDRIRDDEDILEMRSQRLLVSLPVSSALQIDERLPLNRRYSRPWTAQFLVTLARAHYAHFHTPLQVNSAVRTVEFQQHLLHINGNAAPAEGDTASPHLTGQAVDIAKHGLSLTEIAWLRGYLLPLVQEGKVDVEEEFQQACFHISVYKRYLPSTTPTRDPATPHHSATAALAAAIR